MDDEALSEKPVKKDAKAAREARLAAALRANLRRRKAADDDGAPEIEKPQGIIGSSSTSA